MATPPSFKADPIAGPKLEFPYMSMFLGVPDYLISAWCADTEAPEALA